MTGWRGRRWAVITSVVGTVFIAAGAFWLSFTALADLAHRAGIGEGQAWAWPLIVDGVIVVSTVAVVALAGERAAWYPWTLLIGGAAVSVTANALHAIVAADADVPAGLAAAVAAVPPVVLLASTHLTVVLIRTTTQPATAADEVRESVALEVALRRRDSLFDIVQCQDSGTLTDIPFHLITVILGPAARGVAKPSLSKTPLSIEARTGNRTQILLVHACMITKPRT